MAFLGAPQAIFLREMRSKNDRFRLVKSGGRRRIPQSTASRNECCFPAMLLHPHALLSILFVLAFVCSSCIAGELAALLLRFWQIKRLAQALRV